MNRIFLLLLLASGVVFWGCNKDDDPLTLDEQYDAIEKYIDKNDLEGVQVTESGLRYLITEEGTGSYPRPNQVVTVHYEGTLLSGKKFDSSYDRGEPIEFTLGVGNVIKGWDEGIKLLPIGSKALFLIPSNLGYGSRGSGETIGPNQVLIFRVDLLQARN